MANNIQATNIENNPASIDSTEDSPTSMNNPANINQASISSPTNINPATNNNPVNYNQAAINSDANNNPAVKK